MLTEKQAAARVRVYERLVYGSVRGRVLAVPACEPVAKMARLAAVADSSRLDSGAS